MAAVNGGLHRTFSLADEFAICDLCNNTYNTPKVLNCMHTYCSSCLNDLIKGQIGRNGQRYFNCPSCDLEIEVPASAQPSNYSASFRDDRFMAKLVELLAAMQVDKKCDICHRRDEIVDASNWCMDCYDALCDTCLKVHLHVKVTSGHVVISMDDMRQLPLESIMRKKNKVPCDKHGEFITLFCVDCREPLCVQCMAVSHRRCENVITVADAMASRSDVGDIVAKLQSIQGSIEPGDGLGRVEQKLENTVELAKHDIKTLCDDLCNKIRVQESKMMQELEENAEEARKILKERIEPRKAYMKTVKSANQRMNTLLRYGSDVEILMAYNQVRQQLDVFDSSIGILNPEKLEVKVEFQLNGVVENFQNEFHTLGRIDVDTGVDDGISCWGVACTSTDDIIVTDCKNKRIQKFSKFGDLVDHVQLDDEPRDITTCGANDEVAIPLIGRLILFLSTRKAMTLIKRAKTERQYDAISYCESEAVLVVSCVREKRVDIIRLDGDVLKSFCESYDGTPLFEEPRYVAATSEGSIVVSDVSQNTVKCIDYNGQPLFSYTPSGDRTLKGPQGIFVDKIGNIFVADNGNDRVQLLTSHGSFQRFVLVKDSGLERPCAIIVSNNNRLVIVQNDGMVKVYSYS